MEFTVRPADTSCWPDVLTVMGDKGGHGGCWCMFWRLTNQEIHGYSADDSRNALQDIVCQSESGGLVLYADGEPAGWCSVGPRTDFPRVMHTNGLRPDDPDNDAVWSVVCVYVAARHRRGGAAGRLIEAAVDYACDGGAKTLEGYPLADASAGKKTGLSSGTVNLFSRAGFEAIQRAGSGRRLVMSRSL